MRPRRRCRRGFWTSFSILRPPLRFPLLSCILLPPFTYVCLFIALFLFLFLDLSVFLTFLRLSIPFPLLPIFRLYPAHSSLLMSHRTHYSVFLSLYSLSYFMSVSVVLTVLLPSWQFRKSSLPDTTRSIPVFLKIEKRKFPTNTKMDIGDNSNVSKNRLFPMYHATELATNGISISNLLRVSTTA